MSNNTLNKVRIVLVNTSHPGNIGSVARAMKTMGLAELYLVAPHHFPHPKADEMASNAVDVVQQAVVVDTLDQAIADCTLVVGTSTRARTIPWPQLTPKALADKVMQEPLDARVAIVFGREQSGLTNEELHCCHFHVAIPSNPLYSSLNIASAVQVIAYELYVASQQDAEAPPAWDYEYATAESMDSLYRHLESVLTDIQFLNPSAPRQLMTRLRRLFNRARPDVMEVNILRGILGAVEKLKK